MRFIVSYHKFDSSLIKMNLLNFQLEELDNRNKNIDFYKGILMWGVIYGHLMKAINMGFCSHMDFFYAFMRVFDMPFFMILSGFFLNKGLSKKSVKELLADKTSMILFPIIIWTLCAGQLSITKYYFLWAAYICSIICILTRWISSFFSSKWSRIMEFAIYAALVVILYIIYIPWNLFYLFPFFIFGLTINDINFKVNHFKFLFVVFVLGFCFWKADYTPWNMGYDAWMSDKYIIIIYLYRSILAILGVYVVARILTFVNVGRISGRITLCGRETLAIYILQSFVVERFFTNFMYNQVLWRNISLSQTEWNIIGYIVVPIIALCLLYVLYSIISIIRKYKYSKWLFGFKLKG